MQVGIRALPSSRHQRHYFPMVIGLSIAIALIFVLHIVLLRKLYSRRPVRFGTNYGGPPRILVARREREIRTHSISCAGYPGLKEVTTRHSPSPWTTTAKDDFLSLPYSSALTVPGETPLADWALQNLPGVQGSIPPSSFRHDIPRLASEYDITFDSELKSGTRVNSDYDHQSSDPYTESASLDTGPSRDGPLLAESQKCAHNDILSEAQPPPIAPPTSSPNNLPLSSLRTDPVASLPPSPVQALPQAYLPLPPAPKLQCPDCPQVFMSRARLE